MESMWLWIPVLSTVGGRFLYAGVEHAAEYWPHPSRFFELNAGGFSSLGSFYFLLIGVPLWCWFRKMSFWLMADSLAPSLALALAFGKFGCFMAGCCTGIPSSLPWAVVFTDPLSLASPKGVPVHPVQVYESASWVLLTVCLVALRARRHFPGEVGIGFFFGFAVVRSALEVFRGDSVYFGPLTSYQWMAIPLGAAAVVAWVLLRRHHRLKAPDPAPAPASG